MGREDYFRSDLASEARGRLGEDGNYRTERVGGFLVERLTLGERGGRLIGKGAGEYVTVHLGRLWETGENLPAAAALLGRELWRMADAVAPSARTVLVAGMGNRHLTADAVGSLVCDALRPRGGGRRLCLFQPGVSGDTGMESAALVKAAVDYLRPDLTLAVDALAAASMERLCTTVQLCTAGITPGSGVGNAGKELSARTLGCPVVAVGVPTVADSSAILSDALSRAGYAFDDSPLLALLENGRRYSVSLRDADAAVACMAEVIARAIAGDA